MGLKGGRTSTRLQRAATLRVGTIVEDDAMDGNDEVDDDDERDGMWSGYDAGQDGGKRRRRDASDAFWQAVAAHKKRDGVELREHFEKFCSAISGKGKLCGNVLGRCVVHTDDERAVVRENILPSSSPALVEGGVLRSVDLEQQDHHHHHQQHKRAK